MTARALLVDHDALAAAQARDDVLGANGILMDAFYTDVRPDLAAWRESRGLPADPMAAFAASRLPRADRRRPRRRGAGGLGCMRFAFRLQVRPELLDEYRRVHSPVRREMLDAIRHSGRSNYSLFLDETDGTLFGYYEVEDDAAAQEFLAGSTVASDWEAEMGRFFVSLGADGDGARADQAARRLTEVFNLTDQRESS